MASRKKNRLSIPPIGWMLIGVIALLAVVLGAVLLQEEQDYGYNGFPIVKTRCPSTDIECWDVSMQIRGQPYTLLFYNHPAAVEDIPTAPEALRALIAMQNVQNHTLYITVPEGASGEIGIAGVALARVFGSRYGIMNLNVKGAVQSEISCANAGPRTLVLSIEQQELDAVLLRSPNCIVIGATNSSRAVAVAESFEYRVLGVIPTLTGAQ